VLVLETITLAKLHAVIHDVFGWSGGHLHEDQVGEERFGKPDPEYDAWGEVRSERTMRLAGALGGARTMTYVYDFGDNWNHRIKVEKTLAPVPAGTPPLCVAGENATPPDDCGGIYGYCDFRRRGQRPQPPRARGNDGVDRPPMGYRRVRPRQSQLLAPRTQALIGRTLTTRLPSRGYRSKSSGPIGQAARWRIVPTVAGRNAAAAWQKGAQR
jgi:hypothetical protein